MMLILFMHAHGGFNAGGAYEKQEELGNPSLSITSMADTPQKKTTLLYERQPARPSSRAACHRDPNKTLPIRSIAVATASASRQRVRCIGAGGADGALAAWRLFGVIYLLPGAGSNCSFPFVSHFVFLLWPVSSPIGKKHFSVEQGP